MSRVVAWMGAGEVLEGLALAVVRLDVGMRHGAVEGYVPLHSRQHVGRAVETGEIAGARGEQAGQRIDEVLAEAAAAGQPVELRVGEAQALEVVEHLLEAGRDEEVAALRHLAHEELEHRGPVHAAVEIGLQHGELVEIGEQRARRHAAIPAKSMSRCDHG